MERLRKRGERFGTSVSPAIAKVRHTLYTCTCQYVLRFKSLKLPVLTCPLYFKVEGPSWSTCCMCVVIFTLPCVLAVGGG